MCNLKRRQHGSLRRPLGDTDDIEIATADDDVHLFEGPVLQDRQFLLPLLEHRFHYQQVLRRAEELFRDCHSLFKCERKM